MSPDQLRYSCQIRLPGFSEAAQQKLRQAKVLIVGVGGLGCPAAQYLVAAGVGTVALADDDIISVSNLHRQILFNPSEVGLSKALTAAKRLSGQNPDVQVVPLNKRITSHNAIDIIPAYDLVIDCTDNFESRYLVNDACVLTGKPVIYGAIYQYEGQVAVWNVSQSDGTHSINYRDIFPSVNTAMIPDCAEGGVIPTLAGMIGCMQANEAIKLITATGSVLAGKIMIVDAATLATRIIKTAKQSSVAITGLAESTEVPLITAHELKARLQQEKLELIDVRTQEERADFNIGGTHIPLLSLEKHLSLFENGKSFVIYCASGKRSAEAVKIIQNAYRQAKVYSLQGGLRSWMQESAQG